jgi:hypothetical protein
VGEKTDLGELTVFRLKTGDGLTEEGLDGMLLRPAEEVGTLRQLLCTGISLLLGKRKDYCWESAFPIQGGYKLLIPLVLSPLLPATLLLHVHRPELPRFLVPMLSLLPR